MKIEKRINETKLIRNRFFFKKINKVGNTLAKLTNKKQKILKLLNVRIKEGTSLLTAQK